MTDIPAAEVLRELARQVRGATLRGLQATPDEWLTWAPPGTANHILWHAGHALWLQDLLCIRLLTGQGELPPGWSETFGASCRPPQQTSDWVSGAELAGLLQSQLERILELLSATSDRQLAQVADPTRGTATVAARIIHGFHDEAKHSGEMYLLWKLCRTRTAELKKW